MSTKSPDDDDLRLFRHAVADVRPLQSRRQHLDTPRPHPARPPRGLTSLDQDDKLARVEKLLDSHDQLSYLSPGLSKDVLKRLRRGYFGIDAELDLHGLTEYEAQRHLRQFLSIAGNENLECVHIIHGKGFRSDDGHPVLKNRVNQWLRQHPLVLAFCSAARSDGGTGAVMVLLTVR